ncbi:MAG: preprotein translocase subunit SecG [Acidobacteria bacterium]|nr:preprotein translocase subunit SecG [Acidobacteriota bacterium]
MVTFLTIVQVLVALVLILVVLLQSARGGDIASAFGGMGSQTAFGPRGTSNFLSRTTAVLAAVFMLTSLTLAILSNRGGGTQGGSVLSGETSAPTPTAPAQPGQPTINTQTIPPSQQNQPGGNTQTAPVVPPVPPSATPAQPATK